MIDRMLPIVPPCTRSLILGTILCLTVIPCGCNSLTKKVDNPVMVPPPRRVSLNDERANAADKALAEGSLKLKQAAASDIVQTSGEETILAQNDDAVFGAQVVARVNGAPIFASEVLERYGEVLAQAREKLPPDKFNLLRENIIAQNLRAHVERQLIVERMRADMKPDQLKQLDGYLDAAFEKEMVKLKEQLKVQTKPELEYELNKRGTCLEDVRQSFQNNRIAMEYLAVKAGKPEPINRKDLVEYYESHPEEFRLESRVKWKQIQCSFLKSDQEQARVKMKSALEELANGESFEDVARKYSDGVTAKEGGHWDWTQKGSLSDKKLEEILFTAKVGELSDVTIIGRAYQVVFVEERESAGMRPFAEVQQEIHKKIEPTRFPNPRKILDAMLASAVIETDYPLGLDTAKAGANNATK
ncbi:PpiC-type peptidyl-prolyl cis-trans isomerase [Planctopirus limnophila DSM 3776]|uniref:Periplasmic chaperone PpiD n=2 Tax=Planctopirus limnophila TaxID=120 RepID=D5SU91_PLAL2|nr:PpiC-type peptidyl-prolyl cis-trans isomerase [Planctopirus limnophila DSM 3776]